MGVSEVVVVMLAEGYRVRDYDGRTFAIQEGRLISSVNTVGERIAWARAQRKLT
jgi:hypothetical protein